MKPHLQTTYAPFMFDNFSFILAETIKCPAASFPKLETMLLFRCCSLLTLIKQQEQPPLPGSFMPVDACGVISTLMYCGAVIRTVTARLKELCLPLQFLRRFPSRLIYFHLSFLCRLGSFNRSPALVFIRRFLRVSCHLLWICHF